MLLFTTSVRNTKDYVVVYLISGHIKLYTVCYTSSQLYSFSSICSITMR